LSLSVDSRELGVLRQVGKDSELHLGVVEFQELEPGWGLEHIADELPQRPEVTRGMFCMFGFLDDSLPVVVPCRRYVEWTLLSPASVAVLMPVA